MSEAQPPDHRVDSIVLDRYRIIKLIASGAMGSVYRAERLQLRRTVAIKFLHAQLASDPQFFRRFEAEAQALSRLSHPNIVSIIDFGVSDAPFFVMEFVPGRTLRDIADSAQLSTARTLRIIRQVLAGLSHAHKQGIVHRDLKPSNVIVAEDMTGTGDFARILDFGLAKLRGPGGSLQGSTEEFALGTPHYMPPEQTRGDPVDARSDIYSVGIMLFELLSGIKPFHGDDTLRVLLNQQRQPPPRLRDVARDRGFSGEMEALLLKAMAKEPSDRHATAAELIHALENTPDATRAAANDPFVAYDTAVRLRALQESMSATTGPPELPADIRAAADPGEAATADLGPPLPDFTAKLLDRSEMRVPQRRLRVPVVLIVLAVAGGSIGYWAWRTYHKQPTARSQVGSRSRAGGTHPTLAAHASALQAPTSTTIETQGDASIDDAAPQQAADGTGSGAASSVSTSAGSAGKPGEVIDPTKSGGDRTQRQSLTQTVQKLLRSGDTDRAIESVRRLSGRYPSSAFVCYALGNLYTKKRYRRDAVLAYRKAVARSRRYRRVATLIRNTISALESNRAHRLAASLLLRDVGRYALPHLRRAARSHKSGRVRNRAARLIAGLQRRR